MFFLIFRDQRLQTCRNKEILLFQTKFFSRIMIVIRIEYINDQFCKVLLLYRFMIISSVEFIQLKVCNCFGIPHTKCIHNMVSVSYDRHIIRDCKNRFIIFLYEFCFSCFRIFLKTNISTKADFLCILFSSDLERISLFQPVIRHFHLISVFNLLLKHSVTITDSTSICRIV